MARLLTLDAKGDPRIGDESFLGLTAADLAAIKNICEQKDKEK